MHLKKIKTLTYNYGEEKELQDLLFKEKQPILIHVKNFPHTFTLDYFKEKCSGSTRYCIFENFCYIRKGCGDIKEVLDEIKSNKPYRIFGRLFPRKDSAVIEQYVPLWQTIPFRPRFYQSMLKVIYFFGGRGSATEIHFDREHCCILHLCLSGKKQVLLFTEDQNDFLYKVPYIGDSLIEFSEPINSLEQNYPRLKQASGYSVTLNPGDMLFMPKNCWHYMRYLEASTSASYIFYTNKFLQLYGYFTGYFFLGYKAHVTSFKISEWSLFKKFSSAYAVSEGWRKLLLKGIESISFIFLLPLVSFYVIIDFKIKLLKNYIRTVTVRGQNS